MENLEEFYKNKGLATDRYQPAEIGHFNIFDIAQTLNPDEKPIVYTRRDFYKIALSRGEHTFHYADRTIQTSGSTLMFFNPQIPYSFEKGKGECTGSFLIFKEQFLLNTFVEVLANIPMFSIGGCPNFKLSAQQDADISAIFESIKTEIDSSYVYKYDVIKARVADIIHYALKLAPERIPTVKIDAATRLTIIFREALERQFPVESPYYSISLKNPGNYADHLHVHVNSLNRAVKKTTGKTTSQIIAERIASEATILLRMTDWSIAQIAYSLGFEEPAHFTTFYKRLTSSTPSEIRMVA
ncbi:MAG: AraC family transcriptional regulator [Cyclobacteriaceae bacterium]